MARLLFAILVLALAGCGSIQQAARNMDYRMSEFYEPNLGKTSMREYSPNVFTLVILVWRDNTEFCGAPVSFDDEKIVVKDKVRVETVYWRDLHYMRMGRTKALATASKALGGSDFWECRDLFWRDPPLSADLHFPIPAKPKR